MLMTTRNEVAVPAPELLRRFDIPGPRYTSYPTADRFVEAFGPEAFGAWLAKRGEAAGPLSKRSAVG
jgi:oxygen-independent coproporphyrinogen-3 oxidase